MSKKRVPNRVLVAGRKVVELPLQDPTARTLTEVHSAEVQTLKNEILADLRSIHQKASEVEAKLAKLV